MACSVVCTEVQKCFSSLNFGVQLVLHGIMSKIMQMNIGKKIYLNGITYLIGYMYS